MANIKTTQNNISAPRGAGSVVAAGLAGIGAAVGLIELRKNAIAKRQQYNTINMENNNENNKVIDDSIKWATENLKYEEQSNLILTLKNSKKILAKINQNIK